MQNSIIHVYYKIEMIRNISYEKMKTKNIFLVCCAIKKLVSYWEMTWTIVDAGILHVSAPK